jgi:hypothetical protein
VARPPHPLAPVVAHLAAARSGEAVGISGISGTGKSLALKEAVRRGAIGPRVFVFDSVARRDAIERARGNPEVTDPWCALPRAELFTFGEWILRAHELSRAPRFLHVIDPGTSRPELVGRRFSLVARAAFSIGGVDLVGEEAGHYARGAVEAINLVATASRHAGVRLYLVAQRLMRFPVDARANLARMVVHAMGQTEGDARELRSMVGARDAAYVATLRKGDRRLPLLWELGGSLPTPAEGA